MQKIECCNKDMRRIHQSYYNGSYSTISTEIYWCKVCGTYRIYENKVLTNESRPYNENVCSISINV